MQLTFAPAATAILAIVAKLDSKVVILGASAVVLLMLVLGIAQRLALNGFMASMCSQSASPWSFSPSTPSWRSIRTEPARRQDLPPTRFTRR